MSPDARPALVVARASAPALVQDGGRAGWMHHGVPPGGALVPALLARANRAVGNPWCAAAIEAYGELALASRGATTVSIDGAVHALADGATLVVPRPDARRVRYVAVAGGVDVPVVAGGRATLPSAGLGGFAGRALRRGDVLGVGDGVAGARAPRQELDPPERLCDDDGARAVRVVPGPDLARFHDAALATLLASTFTIANASDRVGARLAGPAIARAEDDHDDGVSAPMARGAIEVPRGGAPIVLGPDHPTTGGYPVIAVVARADLGALLGRRPGAAVRFRAVTVAEARAALRVSAAP